MEFSGYLSEYSLAEIFNFVHEGNRTGLLTLSVNENTYRSDNEPQYLWFENGRIVAATSGFDGVGLLTKIGQRKLISSVHIASVGAMMYQLSQPLGLYLKSIGLLEAIQLKSLFNSQTIVPICQLFEIKNRQFNFSPDKLPINAELTGISVPARELGLLGLRLKKDWSELSEKLPHPDYAIQKSSSSDPNVELSRNELKLWQLADGKTPLTILANQMHLSIEIVQQISFRLSVFKFIREVPIQPLQAIDLQVVVPYLDSEQKHRPLSNFFLNNLNKFLRKGERTR
jgi:Domain of unknown function (DUF4388)